MRTHNAPHNAAVPPAEAPAPWAQAVGVVRALHSLGVTGGSRCCSARHASAPSSTPRPSTPLGSRLARGTLGVQHASGPSTPPGPTRLITQHASWFSMPFASGVEHASVQHASIQRTPQSSARLNTTQHASDRSAFRLPSTSLTQRMMIARPLSCTQREELAGFRCQRQDRAPPIEERTAHSPCCGPRRAEIGGPPLFVAASVHGGAQGQAR